MSLDHSKREYEEYYSEMPWTAAPYSDAKIQELAEKYEVEGIPTLVIVSKDGKETNLSDNGREDVQLRGEKAIEEWSKLYL